MDSSLADRTIHIFGLGLMGGSLAMALGSKVAHISAYDIQPHVMKQALDLGIVNTGGGPNKVDADIVVLALPADRIIDFLPELVLRPGTLVIDLGSSKALIGQAMERLPEGILAVGGHPMCGRAENGFANANAGLYAGARFVLCETARTTPEARSVANSLVAAVGAVPHWMDPLAHDSIVALTSHLPHFLSLALMHLAMIAADGNGQSVIYDLAAGGFDGATRLARTDAAMLAGMFITNSGPLRATLNRLRDQLDWLESLLDDPDQLGTHLEPIIRARRRYSENYGERVMARLE